MFSELDVTKMMGHVCLILIGTFMAFPHTVSAESTDVTTVCGEEILMPAVKSTKLRLDGHMLQRNSDCEIKFTLTDTDDFKICVTPLTLNLNCGTKIVYQKYFVASSINDGELTCNMNSQSSYEGECFPYVSTFFIVFEKDDSHGDSSESAYIHVFAEETPGYSSDFGSISSTWISILSVIPMLIVVVCLICWKIRQRNRQQQYANTQITYNTTVGSTTIPTGGGPHYPAVPNQQAYPQSVNQPLMAPGNTGQQHLGGYHVHPTVTAYPAHGPTTPGQYPAQNPVAPGQYPAQNPAAPGQYSAQNPAAPGQYPAQNPTAIGAYSYQPVPQSHGPGMQPTGPPPSMFAAPPPSYDSIVNE